MGQEVAALIHLKVFDTLCALESLAHSTKSAASGVRSVDMCVFHSGRARIGTLWVTPLEEGSACKFSSYVL